MIINNFSPIELKEARKIVDEVKVEEKIEKVYFNDALEKVIAEDIISILKLSFLPNKIGSKTNLTHNIVRYNIAKLDEITTS